MLPLTLLNTFQTLRERIEKLAWWSEGQCCDTYELRIAVFVPVMIWLIIRQQQDTKVKLGPKDSEAVLFNYGSFDPFAAVDLGISEKGSIPGDVEEGKVDLGSSPSAIDSSPNNITRNGCTEPLQERMSALSTPPPHQKVLRRQFPCQTITITTFRDSKALCTLQIALYKLLAVDLKYSVPPLWTIQSHLFGLSGI